MKKILTYISLALALAVSCTKAEVKEKEHGSGMLNMQMRLQQTKAMSADELLATASVKIYKADFSGLVREYTYSTMPNPFYLAADAYRVDVEAGEVTKAQPQTASWTEKSYKGSKEFTITNGNVTDVEVVANVNNAVTAISFDESLAENFEAGYTLTIGLDEDSQLVYDASKSGAEGYFIVAGLDEPSFTWTFTGTLAKDGSTFTKTNVIDNVLPGKKYVMNLKYTIKDGDLVLSLLVDYTTDIVDDTIIFEPVTTGLALTPAYEIWAAHATVYADVDATENEGSTVQFAYSSDNSTWQYADGNNYTEGAWKATLTGLTPSTQYTYKLVIDGEDVGDPLTFTTDHAPAIPNGSFEYVSKVSGKEFYKFYDPSCGVPGCTTKFWASGNGDEENSGSAGMGFTITTVDTEDKYHGNQSVCAQTQNAVVKLAAGNLFTGYFAGLVGTSGGKVNFGRPWTSRPSALKLYCKYTTGTIDMVDSKPAGVTIDKGVTYDRAQIKVAVGTWNYKTYGGTSECPIHVNTTNQNTFVDFYTDPSTIANGDLIIYHDGYEINRGAKTSTDTGRWIEYTIPLVYRNLTTTPTHIVVSCAASQYGDYFTGSTSSRLKIDAVELIYE